MSKGKKSIFRAYDIRGAYPKELDENLAYDIGKAFVYLFKTKKIVIGRDKRESSPVLFESLVKGINSMGCNVIDIGFSTTPLFNYSVGRLKADGGIMITASHNPKEYNGFKLTKKGSAPVDDKEIKRIENLINNREIKEKKKKGKTEKKNVFDEYVKKIVSFAKISRRIKVVVDCGNGMAGLTAPEVFSKLPLDVKYLYKTINQNYPHHLANPLEKKNMRDLQKKVLREKADIGIAFDGDVDRVGFVDNRGQIVGMDLVTALISKYLLKKKPKSKIIYDLRSSWIVREIIKKYGGKPIETRVGHSFIKKRMRNSRAIFAGETSGHYYYKDLYYCENSILAALIILNSLKEKSFSEIMSDFKKYYKSGEINFEVKDPDKKIREAAREYSEGKVSRKDGIKVEFEDWWFNLRKSNTEDLLRLNVEAKNKELLNEKVMEVKQFIEKRKNCFRFQDILKWLGLKDNPSY